MDRCRVLKLLRLLFTKGFQNILSPEAHSQETVKRMSFGTYLCCRSSVCLFRKGTACIYDWHKFKKKLSKLTEPKFRTIQIHSREIKINFFNSKTPFLSHRFPPLSSWSYSRGCIDGLLFYLAWGKPWKEEGEVRVWIFLQVPQQGCLEWMCPSTKGLWSFRERLHYRLLFWSSTFSSFGLGMWKLPSC